MLCHLYIVPGRKIKLSFWFWTCSLEILPISTVWICIICLFLHPVQMMSVEREQRGEKRCPFGPRPDENIIHLFLIDCNQPYFFLILFSKRNWQRQKKRMLLGVGKNNFLITKSRWSHFNHVADPSSKRYQ